MHETSPLITTLSQRLHLECQLDALSAQAWPAFLRMGDVPNWPSLLSVFSDYQIMLVDDDDRISAMGYTVPIAWNGSIDDLPAKLDDAMVTGLELEQRSEKPNTLCALAAIVGSDYQGKGLSSVVIQAMRDLAARCGMSSLIAPVRPILKADYPLIPLDDYALWKRIDGTPFDPWIRVHWNLGGQILTVTRSTLTVTGTVSEWEEWTGLTFPGSGRYLIPGALQPIAINRELDTGRYDDPNVWMKHSVS